MGFSSITNKLQRMEMHRKQGEHFQEETHSEEINLVLPLVTLPPSLPPFQSLNGHKISVWSRDYDLRNSCLLSIFKAPPPYTHS